MRSTVDFLLESLLADALLLNEWGTHTVDDPVQAPASGSTHPHPPNSATERGIARYPPLPPVTSAITSSVADGVDTRAANPPLDRENESSAAAILEFRRRRNRELMRRTRQKQKNSMEAMRTMLQTLTQEFELLRARQLRNNGTKDSVMKLLNRGTFCTALKAAYGTLAETSHRLKAENFLLQLLLVEHDKTMLRLLQAVKSSSNTAISTDEPRIEQTTVSHQEPAAQFFEYKEISLGQAQDTVSTCCQRILRYEKTARPLAYWIVDASGPSQTFGWTVNCEVSSGNNFFMIETKRLPGLSPLEAMQRTWAIMSTARTDDVNTSRRLARSAVLQVFHDNMCVVADDIHHPVKAGVRMRMITVRFRMTTERGYVVGLGSVNPQSPALRSLAQPAVEFMDVFSWHEFAPDDSGGCLATIKSLSQYDTSEELHLRLVNGLCITWRWENEVMQRPMQFLAV